MDNPVTSEAPLRGVEEHYEFVDGALCVVTRAINVRNLHRWVVYRDTAAAVSGYTSTCDEAIDCARAYAKLTQ